MQLYTIQFMMTCGRETEDIYARADERDEMYNQIVAALAPTVVIESFAPFMPAVPEEPKQERNSSYPADLFDSQEEYEQARKAMFHQARLDAVEAMHQSQDALIPPTPNLPRKPYTCKPC
jgi:soluble lytic murein transglycosylase-like protein